MSVQLALAGRAVASTGSATEEASQEQHLPGGAHIAERECSHIGDAGVVEDRNLVVRSQDGHAVEGVVRGQAHTLRPELQGATAQRHARRHGDHRRARDRFLRSESPWRQKREPGLLLRRLPVFAGSFEPDAAEAVCGVGEIKTLDVTGLLGSLVDKSLVVAEPVGPSLRYRLLETIGQFAADRLAEAGEDQAAVAAAHCAHYLSAAEPRPRT